MKPANINSARKSLPFFMKVIAGVLCISLFFEQSGFSQVADTIDISGRLSALGSRFIQERFRPVHLRYLDYDNQANNFKLLLDKGDLEFASPQQLEATTKDLLKYFAIGVTLPNKTFWVNLRPDSPERIIDPALAQTDIGRIFLEADLQLKKDTARYTSPQAPEGREYWDKLYKKAEELFGYENVTIPTLTRPWIVPGEIILRETPDNAYIYKATLKVMLEQDYLEGPAAFKFDDPRLKELNEYSSQLIREIIIPKLTREVNNSKRYSCLRQVYYSLILAQWFKQRFYGRGGFYSGLIDRKELSGLTSQQPWSAQFYFQEYQKSFKDGEYNIKEQVSSLGGSNIRSYFSGGINWENINPGVKLIGVGKSVKDVPIGDYATVVRVEDSMHKITAGPVVSTLMAASPISIAEELTHYVKPPVPEAAYSSISSKGKEDQPASSRGWFSKLSSLSAKTAVIAILLLTLSFPALAAPFISNVHTPDSRLGPGIVLKGADTRPEENGSKGDATAPKGPILQGSDNNIGKESLTTVAATRPSNANIVNFDDVDPFLSYQQEIPEELNQQFGQYFQEIEELKHKSVWSLLNIVKQYKPSEKNDLSGTPQLKYSDPLWGVANPTPTLTFEGIINGVLGFLKNNVLGPLIVSNFNENELEPLKVIKALVALEKKKPELDRAVFGGILKRQIISVLNDALYGNDYKDPFISIQILHTLIVYKDAKGFFDNMDPRLKNTLDKMLEHKDKRVRSLAIKLLDSAQINEPNIIIRDRINSRLREETDPIAIIQLVEAGKRFGSPTSLFSTIEAAGRLQFDVSKDEKSYAADQKAFYIIAKWLDDFGKESSESRGWVIHHFVEVLKLQTDYEKINSVYLPLSEKLEIKPAEIAPYLKELDPQIAKALMNISGQAVEAQSRPAYLQEIEQRYQDMISRVKADNPLIAAEIQALKDNNSYSKLCRIAAFDGSSTRKTLVLDALSGTGTGLAFIREFLIGLTDPSVNVKAAAARAIDKNNAVGTKIIYTGKQGVLIKALKNAVSAETDRVAVGFLVNLLSRAGERGISDAADILKSSLESNKHPLNQVVILEAIESLSVEANSLKEPVISILKAKPGDTEVGVLMKAVEIGGKILQKYDDEALADAIINATVDFPLNPESDTYDKLKKSAVDALRSSKLAVERLEINIKERDARNDIRGVNSGNSLLEILKDNADISFSQKISVSEDMKKVFNPSPEIKKDERVKALTNIGNVLEGSADIDATLRLLTLIGVEPDSDVCNEIFVTLGRINNKGDAIKARIGGNSIVNGLKTVAKDKEGKAYDLRKKAISMLGKIDQREVIGALKEILSSSDENGIIFSALDAALAQIRRGNGDSALIQSMARIFINKFDIHPETAKSHPQLNALQRRLVWVFGQNYAIVSPILSQSLFDEETKSRESYNADKINYIRYLTGLIKTAKASAGRFQISEDVKSKIASSDGVSLSAQKEKPQDRYRENISVQPKSVTTVRQAKKIEILTQQPQPQAAIRQATAGAPPPPPKKPSISTQVVPKVRPSFQQPQLTAAVNQEAPAMSQGLPEEVQNVMQEWLKLPHSQAVRNLIRLSQSPGTLLQPGYLELLRNSSKEPNEEINTVASFIYANVRLDFIVNKPQTAPDIDNLKTNITNPSISFHNMLFKIIGLGRQASPYSAEPIITAYYEIMEKRYPNIETKDSQREKERELLIKAVNWALSNVKESGLYEVRKVLESRLNQGKLGFTDGMLIAFLQRYNPEGAVTLMNQAGINSIQVDPFQLLSSYSVPRSYFDEEREALKLLVDGLKDVLVPSLSRSDLEALKAKPGYFKELTDNLLRNFNDPQAQSVAAHRLGELQDPRARLPLIAAVASINNTQVLANVGWALAQYESPVGAYDPVAGAIKTKLPQIKGDYARAMLGLALGSSGDKTAMEPVSGLLNNDESELVKTIATKSAEKLANRLKDPSLINPLGDVIERGYRSDFISLLTSSFSLTDKFTPSAEAAFDSLKRVDKTLFAGISQEAAAKGLINRIRNFITPDIKKQVLKECVKKECNSVYEAVGGMWWKYWLPRIGFVLLLMGTPAFLLFKYSRKSRKELKDDEDPIQAAIRKKFQDNNNGNAVSAEENNHNNLGTNGSGNSENGDAIFREPNYEECKRLLEESKSLLTSDRPSVEKFSNILTNYSRILRLLPFSLKSKSQDELVRRQDFILGVSDFIDDTIHILSREIKATKDEQQKYKLKRYQIDCVEFWYYFSLYSLGLGVMANMITSGDYVKEKEGSRSRAIPLWLRMFGFKALGDKAVPDLAYLTEEIYKQGNALLATPFYKLPSDINEYKTWAQRYQNEAKPIGMIKYSVRKHWRPRRWFTRVGVPVLGPVLGGILVPTVTYVVLGGIITAEALLLSLGLGIVTGYFIGSFSHWYFINKGWSDQENAFGDFQNQTRDYERILYEDKILENEIAERTQRENMLGENERETNDAISKELESEKPAADAIFVIIGREKGNIAAVKSFIDAEQTVRKDVPVFILDNIDMPDGSCDNGDDFLRLQLAINPDDSFGNFLDTLSKEKGVTRLNGGNERVDEKKRVQRIEELGPRFITINANKPINDLKAAFGNAYRGTQVLKAQGLPGMVSLNADGRYVGPIWNFDRSKTFEILSSWGSIDDIFKEWYGLMMPENKLKEAHPGILRLYEKFQTDREKFDDWLKDEASAGIYDLKNGSLSQMLISTAFMLRSFEDWDKVKRLRSICEKIDDYMKEKKAENGIPWPLHTMSDIIVPIILISQGEKRGDIESYVSRYLDLFAIKHLSENHKIKINEVDKANRINKVNGIYEINREVAVSFYTGLFMAIMNAYDNGPQFSFGMQVFYPPEVLYSRVGNGGNGSMPPQADKHAVISGQLSLTQKETEGWDVTNMGIEELAENILGKILRPKVKTQDDLKERLEENRKLSEPPYANEAFNAEIDKIVSKWNNAEPQQNRGETDHRYQKAREWLEKWLEAERLALKSLQEELEKSSSPILNTTPESADNKLSGIDFRNLPLTNRRMNKKDILLASQPSANEPDEEWREFNKMIQGRIVPSLDRMKEYIETSQNETILKERINKVRICLAEILRIDEESATPSDTMFTNLLELTEKDYSAQDFKLALAKISAEPREFSFQ